MARNSSPPHLPTMSVGRSDPVRVFAASCKARSPQEWLKQSLIALNPSISITSTPRVSLCTWYSLNSVCKDISMKRRFGSWVRWSRKASRLIASYLRRAAISAESSLNISIAPIMEPSAPRMG